MHYVTKRKKTPLALLSFCALNSEGSHENTQLRYNYRSSSYVQKPITVSFKMYENVHMLNIIGFERYNPGILILILQYTIALHLPKLNFIYL